MTSILLTMHSQFFVKLVRPWLLLWTWVHWRTFLPAHSLVIWGLGLLILGHGANAQTASGDQASTLRQAQRLTTAIRAQNDTTIFKLLQDSYPASEQPVTPSRICQDYRGNPYLGDKVAAAYNRLIPKLGLHPDTALLLNTHAINIEKRQVVLNELRNDIVRLVQNADSGELRALHRQIRPGQQLTKSAIQDPYQRSVLRDTFLLAILSKFASISNGQLNMNESEKRAMETHFGPQMTTLRQLDNLLANEITNIDRIFSKGPLNRVIYQLALINESRTSYILKHPTVMLAASPAIPQPNSASLQTAVLDGLSRFIAKRLKEELNASFFERFNSLLQDSNYVELRTLFPNTTRLVTRGSVDYSAIVQLLRTAFDKDLRELFFSMGSLLDHPRYQRLLVDNNSSTPKDREAAQLLRYTRVLLFTLQELQKGTHPLAVIRRVHERLLLMPAARPEARQVAGVALTLAEAFVQEGSLEQAWVSRDQVLQILSDTAKTHRQVFLGLVYQRLLRQAVVLPVLADPNRMYQLVFGFSRLVTDLQAEVDTLRQRSAAKNSKSPLKPDDFVQLYQLALEVTTFVSEHALLHKPKQISDVERVSQAVLEGYQAAANGQYGVTVTNLLLLANVAMPNQLNNRSQVLKYAPFMAALAEAHNPNEMEQAVEAVALPTGSSSVKRKTFSSLTLNAFTGLTGGSEYAYLAGAKSFGNWRPDIGFTAPIGFAYSRGIRGDVYTINHYRRRGTAIRMSQNYHYFNRDGREKYVKGQSIGVFVSIIDLGALVLYRLNDTVNTSPLPQEIKFRQVFSPGVWFMYHAGRSPVSFFAGGQLSPQLRQLAVAPQKVETSANAVRVNVGITIDIPLLTFYARSERRPGNDSLGSIYDARQEDLIKVVNFFDRPKQHRKHPKQFEQAKQDYDEVSRLAK